MDDAKLIEVKVYLYPSFSLRVGGVGLSGFGGSLVQSWLEGLGKRLNGINVRVISKPIMLANSSTFPAGKSLLAGFCMTFQARSTVGSLYLQLPARLYTLRRDQSSTR